MAKRILALLFAFVLPLALTACGARLSAAAPETASHPLQPRPPAEAAVPRADDALVQKIIKTYGAEETTGDDGTPLLKTKTISLLLREEDWTDPEEIEGFWYFGWFLSTTFNEEYDYKIAHYIHPDIGAEQGWFYPEEAYEERIQTYFAVSTDYLRSDESCYIPELEGYWLGGSGGRGEEPRITYTYTQEGDLLTIEIALHSRFTTLAARRALTVRLDPEGGWKYTACQVLPPQ